ncbi:ubiquinone biosynthesis protein UbiH [Rhodoferax koreense]|uniref:Ubiquinone biosynthesis protein UbiH n=1 Tax=Rhodoferax koreensis TaxID=1842727 RepID=A0A1P8K0I5_9BURK|nr:FAD-dependent monooxygenase [Rhodoferax koreense]APW39524.1 ubiquinone biosynthesis protein UbiH [Rhodoferax koreense]
MAQSFDICIRGAGIVGRTLALLLARDRLRVALVAQAGPAEEAGHADVRAYALNAASRGLLEALRCWPDPAHATAVTAMQVFGDDGGEVNFQARAQKTDALAWIVDVPALEARLRDAVRYQPMIEEVTTPPQKAALTVVCEGRASATRAEFGVDFEATPYAQQAIATRLSCRLPHGQVARQWFSNGEILAFLPLGGAEGNSVAVVWSVHATRAADLLALSDEDFAQQLMAASHGALGDLKLAGIRAAWPLQRAQARRWVGRTPMSWALAGDAAHTVHPLAGQGLNLGLGDAAELAQVLHAREYWRSVGDEKLLRRYERARKAALLAVGGATDGLQQLFARQEPALQGLRNWGMKGFEHSGWVKAWVARQAMGAGR